MKQKNFIILSFIVLAGFVFVSYDYFKKFEADMASAASSKPINGHYWSEMECGSDSLCVSNGMLGIGKTNPTAALDINGSINVSGDVCNSTGKCLGQNVNSATFYYGAQVTCPSGTELIMKAYTDNIWYTADKTITVWNKILCGTKVTVDTGDYHLYNGEHSASQCLALPSQIFNGETLTPSVYTSGSTIICKVPIASSSTSSICPTGWKPLNNWSETTNSPAVTIPAVNCATVCPATTYPAMAGHTFSNTNTTASPDYYPYNIVNVWQVANPVWSTLDCYQSHNQVIQPHTGSCDYSNGDGYSSTVLTGAKVKYRGCY
jgi:hypothetical protein